MKGTYAPSLGHFVVKLETYLRMAKIPYEVQYVFQKFRTDTPELTTYRNGLLRIDIVCSTVSTFQTYMYMYMSMPKRELIHWFKRREKEIDEAKKSQQNMLSSSNISIVENVDGRQWTYPWSFKEW